VSSKVRASTSERSSGSSSRRRRGPEGDGIDEQPVLVDEIEPHEGGGKVGTAEEVPVAGLARSSATVSARRSPATTVVLHPTCSACWRSANSSTAIPG